jgi:hypothetical protein
MPPGITNGRKLLLFCRRFAPGRMPLEQWINCRLGFGISIPGFWRHKTAVVKQAVSAMRLFRTTAPAGNVQCDQVDDVRYPLPPGYRASLIAQIRRTIERRLIRTLRWGESTILRFRISRLGLASDKGRPPPPAAIPGCWQCAFRDCRPALAGATNGRDRKRFETCVSRCTIPPSLEKVLECSPLAGPRYCRRW